MEKFIYDENNGLWYELQGDYYIPCLKLPDAEQIEIGIWGQRHLEYIKHHRKGFYTALGTPLDKSGNFMAESMATQIDQQIAAVTAGHHGCQPAIREWLHTTGTQ